MKEAGRNGEKRPLESEAKKRTRTKTQIFDCPMPENRKDEVGEL